MLHTISHESPAPRIKHEIQHSSDSLSSDDHMKEILDSAEKWITHRLLFREYVTALDLLQEFDVTPKLARLLLTRFEQRTSTYNGFPLHLDSAVPGSSLLPLEQMHPSRLNPANLSVAAADSDSEANSKPGASMLSASSPASISASTARRSLSPSLSPRVEMYLDPLDYIDYGRSSFSTWFGGEKHRYIVCVQECAAAMSLGLPEFLAELMVVGMGAVLLPGCYTLTGLLFPAARNEGDLFAEYANSESGYASSGQRSKTSRGIAFKRKKPMMNVRRPENNTASLWLDEDGSVCGFRCIWVHGMRGKLMVDQKFRVLSGCWTLTGEMALTFEQWEVEDLFEGYLGAETFQGRWTAGTQLFGKIQWFVTTVESFYLEHNMVMPAHSHSHSTEQEPDREQELELDLGDEDDGMGMQMTQAQSLHGCTFDIEINESLTIMGKFLRHKHILEVSE